MCGVGGREKKEGGNLGECTMTPLCRGRRRGERGLCLPGEGQDGVVCMGGCAAWGRERKGGKEAATVVPLEAGGDFLEVLLPLDVHVLPPSTLHLLFLPGEVTVGERCVCAHVGTGKKRGGGRMLHLAAKKEEGTGRKRIDDTLIGASSLGAKPTLTGGRRGF